ncbi:hypothetical protein Corgl_0432 [Coriobacterium glomerans PW2]|uniref:Phosphoribosyltransferase n=1 Tax=Coriobacterium glomerans (strain ATCC 49209 / DSM 20642 / JCM 10262 / PW2) TaxID=700015 RepID=F2N775_CORGP|nr:double zinc ribbon domain-containing protein [Coriobacterium glomerans]AEB06550.1 hypothetical protein Corgl_0432 [Coriobacterium glomerans PW2]
MRSEAIEDTVSRRGAFLESAFARLREGALEILSPTRCAACERPGSLLCDRCRSELSLIDPRHACTACGAPFGELVCTECRGSPTGLDLCLAAAAFEGPLRRVIRVYKDAGERRLAETLAGLIADAVARAQRAAPQRYRGVLLESDAIVFVPVTQAALRRRGFDHMEAVAHALARMSSVPVLDALAKRGSADQRALDRVERRASTEGVYEIVADVRGLRLTLIDDVITTGATMQAAADALRGAGAVEIAGLAVARVW